MANHNITHKYLLSILDYNPDTGVFTWRERPLKHFKNESAGKTWNNKFSGKQAGYLHQGYIKICINNKKRLAHVLAYFYVYKKRPKSDIDHFDRNKSNNAINNLREATKSQNATNSKIRKNNTSGYRGVYSIRNKYKSQIMINGKSKYLGCFNTPEEAHAAYCKAAQELHGEFACFG